MKSGFACFGRRGVQRQYGVPGRFVHAAAALWLAVATAGGAAARPLRLLALGDSLTAGFGLPAKDAFTTLLEKRLRDDGLDVSVVNAGVSGDTATNALDRLDWAMGDGVDCAIVEVGANDMFRGVDPAVTKKAIADILAKLKEKRVAVLLAGMVAAPGVGHDYEARFNAIYPDLAKQFGLPLYPFFLEGIIQNADMIQKDGLHPNAKGEAALVDRIAGPVEALVKGVAAAPSR
jgi:acyl-CoA thioesterase-1